MKKVIDGSTTSYSVIENQTSAFTVSASDADGDSLTYSISGGEDGSLFNISSSGIVTFITAPDFEVPTDANGDNSYALTVSVTDGTASASQNFSVTVTNDTSDDATTNNFDGVLIRDGYIQSATVCMATTDADGDDTCEGATYSTTTNADGSFSLEIDDNITATIKLLAEDGFNPTTDDADSFIMGLIDPTTEQNLVISPLSTMLYVDNRFTYQSLKEKLGVDSNFMIRFDDPYLSVNDAASNKAALVNTQLLMMYESLSVLQTQSGASSLTAVSTINDAIFNRDALTETSLGDTTLVRDVLLNLDLPNYTVTNAQLENLSGSFSSFLQKVYVDSNNEQAYFSMTARDYVTPLLKGILDDTVDSAEVDQIIFDTLQWISDKSSRTNLTDVENFRTTTYTVGNSGSAYYTVDGVNADSTPLVIYARVGGMYTNGRIEIVTTYDQSKLDISENSGALEVNGTVSVGPYKGASGYTHKVYLRTADAGDDQHAHEFKEYPGITFYMPAGQGYHGQTNSSGELSFKTKSHY